MGKLSTTAKAALVDLRAITVDIDAAGAALHDSLGGYPATTPGAGPAESIVPPAQVEDPTAPDESGPVQLTGPERSVTKAPDRARLDQIALSRLVHRIARDTAKARRIVDKWAHVADTDTAVARKLTAVDRRLWCHNCAVHGQTNTCEEGRPHCKFCRAFNADYGVYPTLAILETRNYRRLTTADVVRILRRDVPGWKMPKARTVKPTPQAPKSRRTALAAAEVTS
jgi:hypothetical protein